MEPGFHAKAARQLDRLPPAPRKKLADWLRRLEADPFLGQQVAKARMPPLAPGLQNLWRLPLPDGWRVLYTVVGLAENMTQAVVLWIGTHKEYDRLFGYRTS